MQSTAGRAPFPEGFGPFTSISCHKTQEVSSNELGYQISNLKNCNVHKGSGDCDTTAQNSEIIFSLSEIEEVKSDESGHSLSFRRAITVSL